MYTVPLSVEYCFEICFDTVPKLPYKYNIIHY